MAAGTTGGTQAGGHVSHRPKAVLADATGTYSVANISGLRNAKKIIVALGRLVFSSETGRLFLQKGRCLLWRTS